MIDRKEILEGDFCTNNIMFLKRALKISLNLIMYRCPSNNVISWGIRMHHYVLIMFAYTQEKDMGLYMACDI